MTHSDASLSASPARGALKAMAPRTPAARIMTILALAALLVGCAAHRPQDTPRQPAPWRLAPQAEATYQFLVLEDARRSGREEEAAQALEELLELTPSPRIFLEGANLYWRRGEVAETRRILRRGMERFPRQRDLAVTLATTFFAEKRYAQAAEVLEAYLKDNPDDWQVRQEIAAVFIEQQRYAEALDQLESVPENMRTATMRYHYAKAAAKLGRLRQAIDQLKTAVKDSPTFVEAWAELAYLYEVSKDYLAAERTYARILDLGETGQEVWLRLISLNLKLNDPDKALEIYNAGPGDTDFGLEAATLFMDEGFYEQARSILEPLAQHPDAPNKIHFYLAVLAYEGDNDPQGAMEELARIPADDPHAERAFRFRISLLIETGQTDKALELVRQGQAENPGPDFWFLEARIHEDTGDLDLARKVLEQSLERWPENTDLLYALGLVQDKQGLHDTGIETMERIISIDPDHADALNYVGYTLADLGRDLERARVLVNRALELKPDSGYIVDSLAWVLFHQGSLQDAWREVRRAVDMVEEEPTIWEHYGDIAAALGLADEARRGYRKCLELTPGDAEVEAKLDAL